MFNPKSKDEIKCYAIGLGSDQDSPQRLFRLAKGRDWVFRQRSASASCLMVSREKLATTTPFEWVLELSCLSHQGVKEQTDRWGDMYEGGIKTVAGGSGGSFVPSLVYPPAGTELVFAGIYGVADRVEERNYAGAVSQTSPASDQITVWPWSVQFVDDDPSAAAPLDMQFHLCRTTFSQPLAATQMLRVTNFSEREKQRGFAFCSKLNLQVKDTYTVRMGALELVFGPRAGSQEATRCDIHMEDQGAGPQLEADVVFNIAGMRPGGQDDIPEDSYLGANTVVDAIPCRETFSPSQAAGENDPDFQIDLEVEEAFYRPKPLLINPSKHAGGHDAGLLLKVDEKSSPGYNRTLQLTIDASSSAKGNGSKGGAQAQQSVIVLDSDPFLAAQISFLPLSSAQAQGAAHLATWSNADGGGAKWQIPLTQTDFTLTLPSQVLGEEMVKDNRYRLPLDFRLGPPAQIRMQTSYQTTNYAEVPWNLRRLLGYAGQRAPGVTVDRLDYELIYGLSCDVSQPFIRLAEVFALLGAIPGRLPHTMSAPDLLSLDSLAGEYANWRKNWAHIYQRYQSRLAVLEPWDAHVADSLTLKEGMSCVIRYPSDWKFPTPPVDTFPQDPKGGPIQLPPADLANPINPEPRADGAIAPLRGGVSWGFDSQNIFSAVMQSENAYSVKDSASVSDLDMTALGAYGHQEAGFDEGRTSIFGDTALGRTYYYKIERVGRIAVFWNKAKHVIVYERSVVPSRQFYLEQDPLGNPQGSYGIPILRKVQEYIEILEEERRFPDDQMVTKSAVAAAVTPSQRCGCVAACVFPKGTRINVSSAWGSDVNNGNDPVGWKVPLWRKGALPADVYPFPKLSLSIHSQFGSSSVESARR